MSASISDKRRVLIVSAIEQTDHRSAIDIIHGAIETWIVQ